MYLGIDIGGHARSGRCSDQQAHDQQDDPHQRPEGPKGIRPYFRPQRVIPLKVPAETSLENR
jgi:hypothetical protein